MGSSRRETWVPGMEGGKEEKASSSLTSFPLQDEGMLREGGRALGCRRVSLLLLGRLHQQREYESSSPHKYHLVLFLLFPLYVCLSQGSLRSSFGLPQGSAPCSPTQALWLSTSKTAPQPTTYQFIRVGRRAQAGCAIWEPFSPFSLFWGFF